MIIVSSDVVGRLFRKVFDSWKSIEQNERFQALCTNNGFDSKLFKLIRLFLGTKSLRFFWRTMIFVLLLPQNICGTLSLVNVWGSILFQLRLQSLKYFSQNSILRMRIFWFPRKFSYTARYNAVGKRIYLLPGANLNNYKNIVISNIVKLINFD